VITMVKQVKSRRVPSRAAADFNSRQLLLAGLGAVSLSRKEGVRLYGSLVREGRALQTRASRAVNAYSDRIDRDIERVRNRVRAAIAPLRKRAETALKGLRSDVQSRLQPVLARFGVKGKARRAPVKTVRARKPAAKRTPRRKAA
jgi:poly(hydroxyalkanoate) granule-associated protein